MPCYLLHTMEDPDRAAYRDPDLKDVVGIMPKFFCAHCQPIKPLLPSEALRCIERTAPCWKPTERICEPTDDWKPGDAGPTAWDEKGA